MSRRSAALVALALFSAIGSCRSAFCQCKNQITLVPLTVQKAASKARDFVRFSYSLSPSDSLLIQSHEDSKTTIGPYDTGFAITRDGKTMQSVLLRNLPEFRHEDAFFAMSFSTLAVTRACKGAGSINFVTTGYNGDELSPVLLFTIVPSAQGYEISTIPSISGGVMEISTSNPLHLRTWDNLNEGECNACKTAYMIREYELRNGKPIRIRQYRTRQLYISGNYRFDDRRRIRFIP